MPTPKFRNLIVLSAAFIAALVRVPAQTSTDSSHPAEETVRLDPFILSGAQDKGYMAEQTIVGSRSAKQLIDIPAAITIINLEQIQDLSAVDLSEVLLAGVSSVTRNQVGNDDFNIRGFRANQPLRDGVVKFNERRVPMYDVERVEVIKGPSAMLLGANTGLGGTVNVITRATTGYPAGEVDYMVSNHQKMRLTANVTGPLIHHNDWSMDYRVTVGGTHGNENNEIQHTDDRFFGAGFRFNFGTNSSLRLNLYYDRDYDYIYWGGFLDINKSNATGTAYLNQYSTPSFSGGRRKNFFAHYYDGNLNATFSTRLTENSNFRLAYYPSISNERRRLMQGTTVAADNFTLNRTDLPDRLDYRSQDIQADYLHHWQNPWFALDTAAGADGSYTFSRDAQTTNNTMPALDTRFPGYFPNDDAYFAVPHPGSGGLPNVSRDTATTSWAASVYGQETAGFFNDRLMLVVGYRHFAPGGTVETFPNGSNITSTFTKSLDTNFNVHKNGIIVKPLPWLSAYYTDAQNITLQSGTTDAFKMNDGLGPPLQPQKSQDKEAGLKIDKTLGHGIVLTAQTAYFNMYLTNVRTNGLLPDGQNGTIQSNRDQAHGWEADYGMHIPAGPGVVDFHVTWFDATSSTAVSNNTTQAINFVPRKYTFLGKYTWNLGRTRVFVIGGDWAFQAAKLNLNYQVPTPDLVNVFSRFAWGRHWSVQLTVDDVTNQFYIVAVNSTGLVYVSDTIAPRFTVGYRW